VVAVDVAAVEGSVFAVEVTGWLAWAVGLAVRVAVAAVALVVRLVRRLA